MIVVAIPNRCFASSPTRVDTNDRRSAVTSARLAFPASITIAVAYSGSCVPVAFPLRAEYPPISCPTGGVMSTLATPARKSAAVAAHSVNANKASRMSTYYVPCVLTDPAAPQFRRARLRRLVERPVQRTRHGPNRLRRAFHLRRYPVRALLDQLRRPPKHCWRNQRHPDHAQSNPRQHQPCSRDRHLLIVFHDSVTSCLY